MYVKFICQHLLVYLFWIFQIVSTILHEYSVLYTSKRTQSTYVWSMSSKIG
jgi:hypothetical protein